MKRLVIGLAVVSMLGSCQPGPGEATTTTTSAPTTSAVATTTAPTTTIPPGEAAAIHLFFDGYPVAPGPYLVAVARSGIDDVAEAIDALLAGATAEEAAMGLSSTIPAGTKLLGVDVVDGVAAVDLSREFESGGGSLSIMGRVAQITYTATGFPEVASVRFLLDGVPLDVLGGEGLIIDRPQAREDWVDLVPPILVEAPAFGSTVPDEIRIAGSADLESGVVSFAIVDADGLIVEEGELAATPGGRGDFEATVTVAEVPHPGVGSLIVWEWAPDGSQRHVLEYPLTLAP